MSCRVTSWLAAEHLEAVLLTTFLYCQAHDVVNHRRKYVRGQCVALQANRSHVEAPTLAIERKDVCSGASVQTHDGNTVGCQDLSI